MTERFLLFSISALLGSLAFGEPLPDAPRPAAAPAEIAAPAELEPTPPELAEAIMEHDTAVKTLEQQDAEARAKLREWYASSIDTMRQDAVSQGDLDHVLVLDLERQRIDFEITPEEKAQLFYILRELRGRLDRERADQMRHATAAVRAGLQRYAVALDQLAGTFLQQGNVGAARVVERARLSMLGAPPTSACASSYPSTGSSTASSGSAGTSGSSTSSANAGAGKPAFTGSGTVQVKGSAGAASPPVPTISKGKPPIAEKSVTAKSTPAATSPKVAKETTRKAAPSSSGKGASASSKGAATRSSGSGAPASGGARGATGLVAR